MAWSDTKGDWSQREQRRGGILIDQHGRKYSAVIEKKTGDPVFWQAMFQAPLIPPAHYFEPHPDEDRPNDRVINYERWKEDIRRDTDAWELNGRTIARQIPGLGINEDGSFSQAVLDQIGPKPMAIEPVLAAQQGNPWILGKTQTPDPRLKKYFDVLVVTKRYDEPDFSGEYVAPEAVVVDPGDDWTGMEDTAGDGVSSDLDALGLDEQHDPGALGGHRVQPGKPEPGKRPVGRPRGKATDQALGIRRSSGTEAPPPKVKKSHHKKKDPAPAQEPVLVGSPE